MSNEIKRHYSRVHDLGCCITGNPMCVLHHCFGGSMVSTYGIKSQSNRGLSDWLVIPIQPILHFPGEHSFHTIGAKEWEMQFGTQMKHLKWVNDQMPYDIFEKAEKQSKGFKI